MRLFVVDAFSTQVFGGNTAGVVLLSAEESFPSEAYMCKLAAELRYSETAFVKQLSAAHFHIRFFTPTGEIDLCGHATVASFHALRESGRLSDGSVTFDTLAGTLGADIHNGVILMDMASPVWVHTFSMAECASMYQAFGLTLADMPDGLSPAIVSTGLKDIMLPVRSREVLNTLSMNKEAVITASRDNDVIGFHVFYPSESGNPRAYSRNFAPLCGIDEESATGTSNGALTYYLYRNNLLDGGSSRIIQGEAMGRPSEICTELITSDKVRVRVGGRAATVFSAEI